MIIADLQRGEVIGSQIYISDLVDFHPYTHSLWAYYILNADSDYVIKGNIWFLLIMVRLFSFMNTPQKGAFKEMQLNNLGYSY